MLILLRVFGAVVGLATAANVALGLMTTPQFVAPDYLLAAILVGAALIPDQSMARTGLLVGNAFALGVFSVALADRLVTGAGATPGLAAAIIGAGAGLLLLVLRPGRER